MILLLLLGLVLVAMTLVGVLLLWRHTAPTNSGTNPFDPPNFFVATAEESETRATKVLPKGPSEDARHILGKPPTVARDSEESKDGNCAPIHQAEWSVRIDFQDAAVESAQIFEVLSPEWLEANGSPTVYGFSPGTGRWTCVSSSSAPQSYCSLQVAWRYLPLDAGLTIREGSSQRWLRSLEIQAWRMAPAAIQPSLPPTEAEKRARELESLRDALEDATIMVGLVAPEGRPFEGRALWDALTSLGLQWGDSDLFHWVNGGQTGDDSLFEVSTSTDPGYFLPEEAAAGRMRVEDLTFSLSAPRIREPAMVLEAMIRAAKYTQQRLGGTLVCSPSDAPLDEQALRGSIERIVARMEEVGIPPGSDAALLLF